MTGTHGRATADCARLRHSGIVDRRAAAAREGKETGVSESAIPTVLIDNDRARVTEWRFPPGAATGWHRHEFDYVVVPQTTGQLKLVGPGGEENVAQLTTGQPYFRKVGVEHDVINPNDFEFVFVEVELK